MEENPKRYEKKICYFKIYPPGKMKTSVSNVYISEITLTAHWSCKKNDFDMWFFLVHRHLEELYQLLITCVGFLFTALFFVIW